MTHVLPTAAFDRLRRLDTCATSNAIERLNVRLRNEGFVYKTAECLFPGLPPMLGYAVTGIVRTASQPMGGGWYYDRIEWWAHLLTMPAPRVLVLQDVDDTPGLGAFVGEVHANIATALGCVGCVTNGAVRDLASIGALGFQMFAGGLSPSHAYAHIVEWGRPVEIGGLRIQPGDLIHGDRHGVQTIPLSAAAEIPRIADNLRRRERALIDSCHDPDFSIDALRATFERLRVSEANASATANSDK